MAATNVDDQAGRTGGTGNWEVRVKLRGSPPGESLSVCRRDLFNHFI